MNTQELTKLIFDSIDSMSNKMSLHPLDEDRIKGLLKALYADGKELDLDLLDKLAKENHWSDSAAKFLVSKAKQLANGGRVQLKYDKTMGAEMYRKIMTAQPD